MKILAISDLHGDIKPLIPYLQENKVDLIIIAGDITHFGPPELIEELLNEISSFGIAVLALPETVTLNLPMFTLISPRLQTSMPAMLSFRILEYVDLVVQIPPLRHSP